MRKIPEDVNEADLAVIRILRRAVCSLMDASPRSKLGSAAVEEGYDALCASDLYVLKEVLDGV